MKALQLALTGFLYGYRWILSPAKNLLFGGPSCRFLPTYSAYALEAIQRHGPLHGSLLASRRLCRCHPWGGAGVDPVPDLIRL